MPINMKVNKILLVLFLVFPVLTWAKKSETKNEEDKFDVVTMIMHHIADSHEWHILGEGENSVSIPLPVILYTDNGIVSFLSSEFHHDDQGKHIVTKNGLNLTGNIATTLVLSVLTLLIVNFSGNKNYWKHIFWMPGVPAPMKLILAPIEFVGIFTKPFALMIRLFANITAGHIIILSLVSLIFIFEWAGTPSMLLAIFIMILEFVVAFVQAYIFTFLTALFIGMAVEEEHH